MVKLLMETINMVRTNKGLEPIQSINLSDSLRADLGFDSLDLAELTVRIEKATEIDVFDKGLINTVGEVLERLEKH